MTLDFYFIQILRTTGIGPISCLLILNKSIFPVRRLILKRPPLTWRKNSMCNLARSINRSPPPTWRKIYHRSLPTRPNVRINYIKSPQNKKAPTGTFFTHLISQSTITNIMTVEAIWQIKLTQIRIHIILRLD